MNQTTRPGGYEGRKERIMNNTKVYEIENVHGDHTEMHRIRAISAESAKRIYKNMFGGLIKNMKIRVIGGYGFKAEND